MNRHKTAIPILIIVLLLFIPIFLTRNNNAPSVTKSLIEENNDPCLSAIDQYVCYGKQMQSILKSKGVDASIQYVKSVVLVNHGYNLAHILLHGSGEAAYYKEGRDMKKAAAHLEPYLIGQTNEESHQNGFDGYYHGAISAYFEDKSSEESLPKLISNICDGSFDILGITPHSFECYHTIGHGVMHALGNRLHEAINVCADLVSTNAQEGCYFGVFMEQSFLYVPLYHKGMERPDVKGSSLLSVCESFTGIQNKYCAHYVGQVYLTAHPGDLQGAYAECKKLKNFVSFCIERVDFTHIPPYLPSK